MRLEEGGQTDETWLIPGRVLHYLKGRAQLGLWKELLSALASRGRAHRSGRGRVLR